MAAAAAPKTSLDTEHVIAGVLLLAIYGICAHGADPLAFKRAIRGLLTGLGGVFGVGSLLLSAFASVWLLYKKKGSAALLRRLKSATAIGPSWCLIYFAYVYLTPATQWPELGTGEVAEIREAFSKIKSDPEFYVYFAEHAPQTLQLAEALAAGFSNPARGDAKLFPLRDGEFETIPSARDFAGIRVLIFPSFGAELKATFEKVESLLGVPMQIEESMRGNDARIIVGKFPKKRD
jgi:hypothetical protein